MFHWLYPEGWANDRRPRPLPRGVDETQDGVPGDPHEWIADQRLDADEWLVRQVALGLARDRAVRGRRLDLTVQNCVVIMEGDVETEESKAAAGRRAWSTPGVFDVCNRLSVIHRRD